MAIINRISMAYEKRVRVGIAAWIAEWATTDCLGASGCIIGVIEVFYLQTIVSICNIH
jgi:hypothetical protein